MDNTQYTDAICESINIIAQSLVDGIQCDKTITCTIVDDSLKEQGQYLVTDGKTKFNAYSEDTSYRNNTVVYVTIPNGDFTEQKIITGKKVTSSNPFVYKSPFDDMFAISSNLASGINEQGLIANKRKTIGFFKTNNFWNCRANGDNLIFTNNPQPSKIFNNSDMYDILWSLPFCYNENEHPGGYLVIPSTGIDWNKLKNKEKIIIYCAAIDDLKGGTNAFEGYVNKNEIPKENILSIFELHITATQDDFDTDFYIISCQIENWIYIENLINFNKYIPIEETKECDRLGIKANFRTSLTNLKATEGSYGLKFVVRTQEEVNINNKYEQLKENAIYDYKQTYYAKVGNEYSTIALTKDTFSTSYYIRKTEIKEQEYIFYLDTKDMIGNPYMFDGYFSQEKVFDISNIGTIVSAKLYFYENGDFYDKDKNFIPTQENPNIFVKDIEIYFGKNSTSIENESIKLICYNDNDIYKARSNKLGNMKRVQLQWFHREGDQISLIDKDNVDELYLESLSEAEDAVNNGKLVETDLFEMRLETKEKKDDRVYFTREIVEDEKTHKRVFYLNTSEPYQKDRQYFKKGYWQNEDNLIPIEENVYYIRAIKDIEIKTEMPVSNIEYVVDFGNGTYEYVGYIDNFEKDFTYKVYDYIKADSGPYILGYKEQVVTSNTPLDELYNLYYIDYEYTNDGTGDCGVIYNIAKNDDDKLYYIYMKPENLSINWYHHKPGTANADEYGGVDWDPIPDFSEENALQTHVEDKFICEFYPDAEYNETEQIKAVLLYEGEPYYSEVITFSNQDEVIKTRTLDYETGLSISFEDKTEGNYYIYDESNYLIDRSQANRDRKLVLKYGDANLVHADEVVWIIPTENTMIETPDVRGGRKVITDSSLDEYSLNYKIKNYYSYENANNTIICQIKKNGQSFIATTNLSFGQNGSSGSEYTLVLELLEKDQVVVYSPIQYNIEFIENKEEESEGPYLLSENNTYIKNSNGTFYKVFKRVKENEIGQYYKYNDNYIPYNENIKVQALLYDQNHNLITLDNDIKIEWKVLNNTIQDKDSEIVEISRNLIGEYGTIVSANLTYEGNNLTSYLPIPVKPESSKAVIYQGPTQIVYNSFGIASYYKDPIKVLDKNKIEINEELNIKIGQTNSQKFEQVEVKQVNGFPKIENSSLIANSFFVEELFSKEECLCIVISDSYSTVWSQPILYLKNKYFSSTINHWDGELTFDEKGNTILARMIGAGSKDINNLFSGVIMGDWSGKISGLDNRKSLGLYGFNAGDASFGFCVDGTAFIGKAGRGQIIFDGNSGEIKSSDWDDKSESGTYIDIDNGRFQLRGFYTNSDEDVVLGEMIFNEKANISETIDGMSLNLEPAAINVNEQLFIYWDGTLAIGNRKEKFEEFSNVTSGDVGVMIDPSGKMRAWSADFGNCNINTLYINTDGNNKTSYIGYVQGSDGIEDTKNIGFYVTGKEYNGEPDGLKFYATRSISLEGSGSNSEDGVFINGNQIQINGDQIIQINGKQIQINGKNIEEYIKSIINASYIKGQISSEYATKEWVKTNFSNSSGGTIGGTPVMNFGKI